MIGSSCVYLWRAITDIRLQIFVIWYIPAIGYLRHHMSMSFCNVWARQGSSLCNRVRLNFQVCALRDTKMWEWKRSGAGHVGAHVHGHQHGVSIRTKLYKFGWNTFPNNARKNYRTYLNLGKLFIYQSFFISQFIDLIYWMVTFFIFDGVTQQTSHSWTNRDRN